MYMWYGKSGGFSEACVYFIKKLSNTKLSKNQVSLHAC